MVLAVIDESAKSIAVIIGTIAFVVGLAKAFTLALQSLARLVVGFVHERAEQTRTTASTEADTAEAARAKAAGKG